MKTVQIVLLALITVMTACAPRSKTTPATLLSKPVLTGDKPATMAISETRSPTQKEIIRCLLASHELKLGDFASCSGVGSDFNDTTIGDYVSGLLAQQTKTDGKNWIEVGCEAAPESNPPVLFWKCRVVFHRITDEERGGWGVRFLIRAADGMVVKDSFECTGGG